MPLKYGLTLYKCYLIDVVLFLSSLLDIIITYSFSFVRIFFLSKTVFNASNDTALDFFFRFWFCFQCKTNFYSFNCGFLWLSFFCCCCCCFARPCTLLACVGLLESLLVLFSKFFVINHNFVFNTTHHIFMDPRI